jgi:hypothetical protein
MVFTSALASLSMGQNMKRTSKDLRRLYGMGFLKRERRKRSCVINLLKPGKLPFCNKGFEYSYSFSEQGISYLHWLKKERQIENVVNAEIILRITRYAPKEDTDKFLDSIKSKSSSKFKSSKFWWSMDPGLLNWIQSSVAQLETKNQQLETKNQQLETKNQQLETKIILLEDQNDRLKRDISDLKKRPSETFQMAEDAFSDIKSSFGSLGVLNGPIIKTDKPTLELCKMSVETNEEWFKRRFTFSKILYNLD